jgi:hypothetical protein
VRHNIPFLRALLARDEVADGGLTDTRFIERHFDELARPPAPSILQAAAAVAAWLALRGPSPAAAGARSRADLDPWQRLGAIAW